MKLEIRVHRLLVDASDEASNVVVDIQDGAEIIGCKTVQTTGGLTAVYLVEASPHIDPEPDNPGIAADINCGCGTSDLRNHGSSCVLTGTAFEPSVT